MINTGASAHAELTVSWSDTAEALMLSPGDHFPPVFATSRMIALMEIAAARLMHTEIGEDQLSVGVALQVKHTAATPIGGRVRAVATLSHFDGKQYHFKVEAFDDAGPIGEGQHSRAIVRTERLLAGAARRIGV